ncbi:hypothetical protein WMF39_46620 [Sorangium sp. So ce1504]|uniref:hypothetical protein n=1 Tax=Sorangium sp. So ce1504 TaxID=3133337 RepID=UPI003F60F684
MSVVSLRTLAENADVDERGGRNFAGQVDSWENFFRPEVLERLDRAHDGVYAFLCFLPSRDEVMKSYIASDALATDAGHETLALFIADDGARWPKPADAMTDIGGLCLNTSLHPAIALARACFPQKALPHFPGILFFTRIASPCEPVFVSCADCTDLIGLTRRMQLLFDSARVASRTPEFSSALASTVAGRGILYTRGGRTEMREHVKNAFFGLAQFKTDLVAAVIDRFVKGK